MLEKIKVWIRNASITHHVAMAKFLRRRGWVVFYLPEDQRECKRGSCWLRLYMETQTLVDWLRGIAQDEMKKNA